MLGMVFLLPAGFGLLVWNSFRTNARRRALGQGFQAGGDRIRWVDPESDAESNPGASSGDDGAELPSDDPGPNTDA